MLFEKLDYILLLAGSLLFVLHKQVKLPTHLFRIFQILLIISVVYNVARRDYYLPFLGRAVYPCDSLSEKQPVGATVSVEVHGLKSNTNVIYWASEGDVTNTNNNNDVVDNPWDAYGQYDNAGVTKTNTNGTAILRVRPPVKYKVGRTFVGMTDKVLDLHVHYRECYGLGLMGPVRTIYL